jgi:hypothetical protein
MADIKTTFGTPAAMTLTLASLADAAGRAATAIVNTTTKALSADVRVKVKTGASGVSATGYVAVYLVRSEDGSSYDDGFAGSDAAFTPVNATLLGILTANANATTYQKVFDLAALGITLPEKWSIAVLNKTGAALDSTGGNHEVKYTEKYYTVA